MPHRNGQAPSRLVSESINHTAVALRNKYTILMTKSCIIVLTFRIYTINLESLKCFQSFMLLRIAVSFFKKESCIILDIFSFLQDALGRDFRNQLCNNLLYCGIVTVNYGNVHMEKQKV